MPYAVVFWTYAQIKLRRIAAMSHIKECSWFVHKPAIKNHVPYMIILTTVMWQHMGVKEFETNGGSAWKRH